MLYLIIESHAKAFFSHLVEQGTTCRHACARRLERILRCGRLEDGFVQVKRINVKLTNLARAGEGKPDAPNE